MGAAPSMAATQAIRPSAWARRMSSTVLQWTRKSWWAMSASRIPRSWRTSFHFQPDRDSIRQMPSSRLSKTQSQSDRASASKGVKTLPSRT